MFRIDAPSAVGSLPTPQAVGTPGYFGRGNIGTNTPPTTVTADFLNMIQEELAYIVAQGGLTLSKTNMTQVLTALQTLFLGAGLAITGSLASSGYIAIPVGSSSTKLIVQWGTTTFGSSGNSISTSFTFPTTFPTACWAIIGNSDGPANGGWHPVVVSFDTVSTTGSTVWIDSASTGQSINAGRSVRWIAIGK